MIDFIGTTILGVIAFGLLCGAFFVAQLVVERFILVTLPIILELYLKLRHPDEYRRLAKE